MPQPLTIVPSPRPGALVRKLFWVGRLLIFFLAKRMGGTASRYNLCHSLLTPTILRDGKELCFVSAYQRLHVIVFCQGHPKCLQSFLHSRSE